MKKYWYVSSASLDDLLDAIEATSQKTKIHVINVFHDGVIYVAVYIAEG